MSLYDERKGAFTHEMLSGRNGVEVRVARASGDAAFTLSMSIQAARGFRDDLTRAIILAELAAEQP